MASTKQLGVVVIALAVATMAIPALGFSPLDGNQATPNTDGSVASSQQNVQHAANQSDTNDSTQQTDTATATQSVNHGTTQQDSAQDTTHKKTQTDTANKNKAGDRSLMDVLGEAQASFKQMQDVNATVRSMTTISSGSVERSYNATLALSYERPNKFRLEFLKPEPQAGTVIASDGTGVQFYNPANNTVRTHEISEVFGQSVSQASTMELADSASQFQTGAGTAAMGADGMNVTSLENPSQLLKTANVSYEGTTTVNGYKTDVISISDANASLGTTSSTTIYLNQKTNLPVKIVSNNTITRNGETTTITSTLVVTDLTVNAGIPDSVFDIDAPDDAEQVDDEPTTPDETAYYQVDFVVGEPIENLRGPEGTYTPDELIRFVHGSTAEPVMRRAPGAFAYAESNVADRIESQEITVENGTATVTFTVAEGSEPVELSLVSYTKPGPGWSPETEDEQEFVDADTETFDSGTYTLTVDLPGEGDNSE